jgi:hypothetical protein
MMRYLKILVNYTALAVLAVFLFPLISGHANADQDVLFPDLQTPPIALKASDELSNDLISGPNYKVEQSVINDGLINTYRLSTDYGPLQLESTALLKERINELLALRHMEELKGSNVFKDALKEGAKASFRTAKGLVTKPVDTVSGIATGVGRWFSDVKRSVSSDDPHQENALKTALGYSSVKRKFAYEYKIDPYTNYEPVQKRLSELSQSAFAGGITTKVAFGAVKKTAGTVLRITGTADTMRKLVRDKSPAELEDINTNKLLAMGVSRNNTKHFLNNPNYSPQEATLLVGALESMRNVSDRNKFVAAASFADEESVARFMRLRAQMMASYSTLISPVSKIIDINGTPFLKTTKGVVVGLFPLDYVAWTGALYQKEKTVSDFIENVLHIKSKELWVTGRIDSIARRALESRGWKVKTNVGASLLK